MINISCAYLDVGDVIKRYLVVSSKTRFGTFFHQPFRKWCILRRQGALLSHYQYIDGATSQILDQLLQKHIGDSSVYGRFDRHLLSHVKR